MRISAMLVSILVPICLATPAMAACETSNAQWVSQGPQMRHVLYGHKGVDYGSHLFIEEWRGDRLAWRGRGRVTCSLGVSVCYALMYTDNPPRDGHPASAGAVLETIDENDDGLPEWVVLAALAQDAFRDGGLKVKWFNGFKPSEYPNAVPSNIYKLDGCRPQRPKGPIYGIPELCSAYLRDGSLVPDLFYEETEGTWWMNDSTVAGQDGACDIIDKDDGNIELACQSSGDDSETHVYREDGRTRYVDDIALTRCKP